MVPVVLPYAAGRSLTARQGGETGLSTSQARERLARDGPNELPRSRKRTAVTITLEVLREPMLAMLLAAGGIYFVLGDKIEAVILLLFAALSITITIVQEARTEGVLDKLRDMAAPRALVIRDGETLRIPGREVVQGDVLVIEQGDRVSADALLIESRDAEVDESLLTGESVPVSKRAMTEGEALAEGTPSDDSTQVFAGSILTRGAGIARVCATGERSLMGRIGRSLRDLEPEVPRLQRETARVVDLCAIVGVAIAAVIIVLYGLLRGSWSEALLAGIATAMSLLPEEFPVVLTVFLAMGAWRIGQVGVLTRHLAAIEAMGSATVLCTDKTGTLTQNRMTVMELWLPESGHSQLSDGAIDPALHPILRVSALASAPVPVDPMEVAFHAAARDAGIVTPPEMSLVHSYGLRADLLAVSNLWRPEADASSLIIAAKGAPEAIARLCALAADEMLGMESAAKAMAARGMRVLGVATGEALPEDTGKPHEGHRFRFIGLVGLADPLRSGVRDAVEKCRRAGIRVVMITGDYPETAKAIARQAGIEDGVVMTGAEIAALDDDALAARVSSVGVFARIMPDQKLRIVSSLKASGEVVAMTGDGVNDAPALKAAHIGVAMGKRGTDVAREAAAIVLVEDDFGAIIDAIRVGRRIYDNIRKAIRFIFAIHVPIAGLAILPLVTGLPIVLGPLQIALLEMVIDPVCAIVFEAEGEEADLMRRPPRDPSERLFSPSAILSGFGQGASALILIGSAYLGASAYGLEGDILRTLAFFSLLAATIALVLANRSFSRAAWSTRLRHNLSFRYVLAFVAAGAAIIFTVPQVRRILKFTALGWLEVAIVAAVGMMVLVACELVKGARRAPAGAGRPPAWRASRAEIGDGALEAEAVKSCCAHTCRITPQAAGSKQDPNAGKGAP